MPLGLGKRRLRVHCVAGRGLDNICVWVQPDGGFEEKGVRFSLVSKLHAYEVHTVQFSYLLTFSFRVHYTLYTTGSRSTTRRQSVVPQIPTSMTM